MPKARWLFSTPSTTIPASAIPFSGGTYEGDLSNNTESGFTDSCGTGNTIDEWVSYTAPCNGVAAVSTCYSGTAVDTILSVWEDASCTGAFEVACNDDALGAPPECDLDGANRKSLALWTATAGTTYVVRVSAYNNAVGAYEISMDCTP